MNDDISRFWDDDFRTHEVHQVTLRTRQLGHGGDEYDIVVTRYLPSPRLKVHTREDAIAIAAADVSRKLRIGDYGILEFVSYELHKRPSGPGQV